MATKSAKQAPEETPAKPKSKKLLLIIIIVVLLLGIAGGAGWYFTRGASSAAPKQENATNLQEKPTFIALEPFTVNLQREDGDQFLQVGMSLKVYDPSLQEKIKASMPEVRSKLLLLLSSKRASDLSTVAGKKKLADEIITQVDSVLGIKRPVPKPVAAPASDVAASGVAAASEVAAAPAPVEENTEDSSDSREGIVAVLFTSFIIQ
jgi:flagellar protein FliL